MNNQYRIALASMRLLAATLKAGLVLAMLGGNSAFAGVSIAIDPFAIAQTIQQATQSTPRPVYRSKPAATSPAQKKRSKSPASNEAAQAESASRTQTQRGQITDGNSLQSNLRLYRRYVDGAKLRTDEILTCFVTVGYIQGLEGGSEPWATLYKAECPYAVPRMPVSQLIQVVDKYLNDHPEELHQPAATLFFAAISKSFPNPEFKGRDNTTTTAPVAPATARGAQIADPVGMVREVTPSPGMIGTEWTENDSSPNAGKAAGQRETTAGSNTPKVETVTLADIQSGAATFNGRLQQAVMDSNNNDAPGKEPLFQQYGTRTFTAFKKHPELVSSLKELNPRFDPRKMGTSDLSSIATGNGRTLLILNGCVPHDCGGTTQIVAFEPSTKLVYLLQPTAVDFPDTPPDAKFNLYGNPDSFVRTAMYNAGLDTWE